MNKRRKLKIKHTKAPENDECAWVTHGHLHTRPDMVPPQAKYLPNQPKYELEIS